MTARRKPIFKSHAENIFFTTCRLETGNTIGTAFVIRHEWKHADSEKTTKGNFLVTNKHVVGKSDTGRIKLTVVRKDETRHLRNIDIPKKIWSLWCPHPDPAIDVCVIPFGNCLESITLPDEEEFDYYWISTALAAVESTPDIGLIEDVIFVGYPNGMFDKVNNLPVARRGITASPSTVDYDGRPVFLIDASIFPGSSGSPVFLYNVGTWRSSKGTKVGDRIVFLGVLSSVFRRLEDGTIELREVPTDFRPHVKVPQMIDLGVVFKARVVLENINHCLRQHGELSP